MSFRQRLTLFFFLIVVVPMVALAVLVTQLSRESQTGKADARLSAGLQTGLSIYTSELDRSERAAREAARDSRLVAALRARDEAGVRSRAQQLRSSLDLAALAVANPAGRELVGVGSNEPVAESELTLRSKDGSLGSLRASATSADAYARQVEKLTGEQTAVLEGQKVAASTVEPGDVEIPAGDDASTLDLPNGEMRVATVPLRGAEPGSRLALFGPIETGGFATTRPVVAAALVAFFALALLFIVLLVRSLQGQIAAMLDAARRIGGGDFSRDVPVEGRDEMAGLASEFNKMSGRLAQQMAQLRHQRAELERSIRRIGEAFAHGLDRDALLELIADTALAACEAESCRIVLGGRIRTEAQSGIVADGYVGEALSAAESKALQDGAESEETREDAYALAGALTGIHESKRSLGAMSIVRHGAPFDSAQRELFRYLVGQASVSVENIDLHEVVSEQAITDELTGLSNQRRLRVLLDKEAARAQRFSHELSLFILDIDDFKQVNDAHGHLQGDEVLRTVGRILLEVSRGVDEPARYGGEEFVLVLPETGPEGGLEVAERARGRIEAAEIPLVSGSGAIRVTASLGVASMPRSAVDVRGLIAAADAALYRAKRAGKNRCELAPEGEQPPWPIAAQGQPA